MSDHRSATDALILQGIALWRGDGIGRYAIIAGAVLIGLLFLLMLRAIDPPDQKPRVKERILPKMGGPGWIERRSFEEKVSVAGVHFDRAWRHIGVVATTGGRKSTLLAMLREQIGVPCIFISGDHAPPMENLIRSRGGYVWKPRGPLAWYPWGGSLESAVQRAEVMHPANGTDVGVHRAGMKQAARLAWGMADSVVIGTDDEGRAITLPRDLSQVRKMLPKVARGPSTQSLVENWTLRLQEIEQSLGASLGPGLDIVEAVRAGKDVGIFLNAFQDVSNRKRFASIAVLEALRAADEVGNIAVIVDELDLVGAELLGEALRTFRVRKVVGVFASQVAGDFPQELRGNIHVWFLGQQSGGDKASRMWSSDVTFGQIGPEEFGEHALKHGQFYVAASGRVQRAVVPIWKSRRVAPVEEPGVIHEPGGVLRITRVEPDRTSRIEIVRRKLAEAWKPRALPAGRKYIPEWIERNPRRREIYDSVKGTEDEYGQHLWTKGRNKEYGKSWYLNVGGWQAHFLFWAWKVLDDHERMVPGDLERFYARNPDVAPFQWPAVTDELVLLRSLKTWMQRPNADRDRLSLSIDHCCPGFPNPLCQNWRHLQLVADEPGREGSNSKLRQQRRKGLGRLAAEVS